MAAFQLNQSNKNTNPTTPKISGMKNHGKFFGLPEENKESFEVFGFI